MSENALGKADGSNTELWDRGNGPVSPLAETGKKGEYHPLPTRTRS